MRRLFIKLFMALDGCPLLPPLSLSLFLFSCLYSLSPLVIFSQSWAGDLGIITLLSFKPSRSPVPGSVSKYIFVPGTTLWSGVLDHHWVTVMWLDLVRLHLICMNGSMHNLYNFDKNSDDMKLYLAAVLLFWQPVVAQHLTNPFYVFIYFKLITRL